MVNSAVIHLGDGKSLKIRRVTSDPNWVYVKSVRINAKELEHPWFDHSLIHDGGEVVFEMAQTPQNFGVSK